MADIELASKYCDQLEEIVKDHLWCAEDDGCECYSELFFHDKTLIALEEENLINSTEKQRLSVLENLHPSLTIYYFKKFAYLMGFDLNEINIAFY